MITCPWCGTSYAIFQSNCKNCGGPLNLPPDEINRVTASAADDERVIMPPPPPRPISNNYVWRLLFSDGWAIASFVFTLMGLIFSFVGFILTIAIITAFVGLPFLAMGLAFLGGGIAIIYWRYQEAAKVVNVLRIGEATRGQITNVEMNYSVRVNGRHPWTITYQFHAMGQSYEGKVTTLNPPGQNLQQGRAACVLYAPTAPTQNTLYPHP